MLSADVLVPIPGIVLGEVPQGFARLEQLCYPVQVEHIFEIQECACSKRRKSACT